MSEEKNRLCEKRPWGKFEILLDSEDCKVKRITVNPKQKLSLQSHDKREETWHFISGKGKVTIDGKIIYTDKNNIVYIPKKAKHRIENETEEQVVFIEIQTGEYFGEDDIVRYEDIYGRT